MHFVYWILYIQLLNLIFVNTTSLLGDKQWYRMCSKRNHVNKRRRVFNQKFICLMIFFK